MRKQKRLATKLVKNLLSKTLIFSTAALALSSCATFDPTPYNPTRVHPDGVGVEYKISKTKKNKCTDPSFALLPHSQTKIIQDMTGYICLSPSQYQKLYTEYLNYERSKCSANER